MAALATAAGAVKLPPIKWAQRKDSIYVTIDIPDVDAKTAQIAITGTKLTFNAQGSPKI